jgi:hypothetical protein
MKLQYTFPEITPCCSLLKGNLQLHSDYFNVK